MKKPRTWKAWAVVDERGLCSWEGAALIAMTRREARFYAQSWGNPCRPVRVTITEEP